MGQQAICGEWEQACLAQVQGRQTVNNTEHLHPDVNLCPVEIHLLVSGCVLGFVLFILKLIKIIKN